MEIILIIASVIVMILLSLFVFLESTTVVSYSNGKKKRESKRKKRKAMKKHGVVDPRKFKKPLITSTQSYTAPDKPERVSLRCTRFYREMLKTDKKGIKNNSLKMDREKQKKPYRTIRKNKRMKKWIID